MDKLRFKSKGTDMSPRKYSFWALLLIFLSTSFLAQANLLDHWHWRNPSPFANPLRSITYGNGKFVAVGDGGVIHTSPDGISWDGGQRPLASLLHKVIFANGQFVAVGENGAIVASSDGNSWTNEVSGTTNTLYFVTYGNGVYVASGQSGSLVISTNGSTWVASTVATADLDWVAAGNGVFILPSTQTMAVQVSFDLQTWATETLPNAQSIDWPHYLFQAEFGNGVFVAAAQDETKLLGTGYQPTPHFYYSTDGTNWTQGASGGAGAGSLYGSGFQFLDFANGAFYDFQPATLGSSGGVGYSSPNGTTSTNYLIPVGMADIIGLSYGSGNYVAPGLTGDIWTSTDAQNWTSNYSGLRAGFYQIIRGSNSYVVLVDSQPVLTSSDGINFVSITNSPTGITALVYDGGVYVGVSPTSTQIFTSTNLVDWFARNPNVTKTLLAVCHGSNGWVAVGGSGTVTSSANTLAWTERTSGTANHLFGVAYGNSTYVAVGNSGTVITSPDGATWTAQYSGTLDNLTHVRFLNGLFVAVGAGGTILISTDGINWSLENSGSNVTLKDVAYGDGLYLACGSDTGTTTKTVFLSSSNGTNWVDVTTKVPVSADLNSIAFLNGSFWICGANGALVQSDSTDGIPRIGGALGSGGFQLNILQNVPQIYRIQVSTNLSSTNSWQDIATVTNASTWSDTNAAAHSMRFYRVVAP